jgi:2-hydroxychromene-2-carboxylate isomerase
MSEDAAAYSFRTPLTVCVDLKNPHAYLALAPTLDLGDELDVEIDWLPLVASPLKRPTPPPPNADRGTLHRWHRGRYQERDLQRYATARGLQLRDPYRAPDSSLAATALLWVTKQAPKSLRPFLEHAFEGYWTESLDIEDPMALRDLITNVGAPADGFAPYAATAGRAELAALDASLRAAGAFSVPTYWVGAEPFLGRQHLPMIRRLLRGDPA